MSSSARIGGRLFAVTPAVILLVLTSVHHAYGAAIYDTPWRLHVVYLSLPIGLAIVLMANSSDRFWTRSAAILALLFPVAMIGMVEGGYNHVVKNAVYFTLGESAARSLFSSSAYEMPNDLFFEITGIAQFLLGLLAAQRALKVVKDDGG